MRRVAKKKVSGRGAALPVYGSGQENEGGHVKGLFRWLRQYQLRMPTGKVKRTLTVAALCILSINMIFATIQYARSRNPCAVAKEARVRHSAVSLESKVPKIVHQQWKTEIIGKSSRQSGIQNGRRCIPSQNIRICFDRRNARSMIATHFPWFLKQYDGYPHGIQRADAARYFFMWLYGGVYADMDYEPLVNFWPSPSSAWA